MLARFAATPSSQEQQRHIVMIPGTHEGRWQSLPQEGRDPRDALIEHLLKENEALRAERTELQSALRIQSEELENKKREIDILSLSAEKLEEQNRLLRAQNDQMKAQLKHQEEQLQEQDKQLKSQAVRISALGMFIFLS